MTRVRKIGGRHGELRGTIGCDFTEQFAVLGYLKVHDVADDLAEVAHGDLVGRLGDSDRGCFSQLRQEEQVLAYVKREL